jgi:hypothetical protein
VWTAAVLLDAFGLTFRPGVTRYGHGPKEAAAVRGLGREALNGYDGAAREDK